MKNWLLALQNLQQADDKKRPIFLTFVLPILSIVVSLVLLATVVVPQAMNYFRVNSQVNDLNQQVSAMSAKAGVLQKVSTSQYQTELDTVLQALPVDRDYVTATSQLQLIAQQSGVALTNLTFGDSATANTYQVKAEVTGQFPAIKSFIHKVDNAPRVMKVAQLDISPDKPPLYLANVTVLAYFFPLTATSQKVDQPVSSLSDADLELIQLIKTSFAGLPGHGQSNPAGAGKADPFQ